MATKEFNVKLGLQTKEFTDKLKVTMGTVAKSAKDIGNSLSSVGKDLSLKISAPLIAMAGLSVKLFDSQVKAENKLREALKANGQEVEETMKDYSRFASQLQSVSTIDDDITIGLLQIAQSMGVTGENAKLATIEALSLSKALGVSEDSAIRMTVALSEGNAEMLQRYIPTLKNIDNEAEKVATAHKLLAGMFGAVTAEAKEGLGPLNQLKNRFGDLLEKFGKIISEGLTPFINIMDKAIIWVDGLSEEKKKLIVQIGLVVASIGPLLIAMGSLFKIAGTVSAFFAGPLFASISGLILPMLAIGIAIVSVIGAWEDLTDTSEDGLKSWVDFFVFVNPAMFALGLATGKTTSEITNMITNVDNLKKAFRVFTAISTLGMSELAISIKNNWKGILIFIVESINKLIDLINEMIRLALINLNLLISGLNKISGVNIKPLTFEIKTINPDNVTKTLKSISDAVNDTAEDLGRILWFKEIKEALVDTFSDVKDFFKSTGDLINESSKSSVNKFTDNFMKGIDKIKGSLLGLLGGTSATPTPEAPKTGGDFVGHVVGSTPLAKDPDEMIPSVESALIEQTEYWKQWADTVGTIINTVKETLFSLYETFTTGFGEAINSMIFEGAKFADVMKNLMTDMAKQIISALVKMGIQYIATAIIGTTASKAQGLAEIMTAGATTYAHTFSSISAIPIIGPALAPGMASGAEAFMLGTALPKLALAEGGITQGPTNALIGEAGQEAVIPLDKLDSIMGSREQNIIINLDGRQIAKSVIKHSPREIRLGTGVIM